MTNEIILEGVPRVDDTLMRLLRLIIIQQTNGRILVVGRETGSEDKSSEPALRENNGTNNKRIAAGHAVHGLLDRRKSALFYFVFALSVRSHLLPAYSTMRSH